MNFPSSSATTVSPPGALRTKAFMPSVGVSETLDTCINFTSGWGSGMIAVLDEVTSVDGIG